MDSVPTPELATVAVPAVVHSGMTITAANAQFESVVANPPGGVTGESLTTFLDPSCREALVDACDRVADGAADRLAVEVGLETDGQAEAAYIAVNTPVLWDDTRAVQTEFIDRPPLGEEDSLSRSVLEQSPTGITILDGDHEHPRILYANDAFLELTNYDREAVLGRELEILTGKATDDDQIETLHAAIANDDETSIELQCYASDGSVFWNDLTLSPLRVDSGDGRYWVGYHTDISARKATEEQQRIFETYAEESDDVMVVTDSNGVIQQVNDAFHEVTGYSPTEAIGKTPRILKSGEHDADFYEELWNDVLDGNIWESVITNRTKQGYLYETTQKVIPVTDDDGEIRHFVAIEREITQKQLRQQILDVLNRILRHNVRNCVTVVDAHAQMLESNPEDAKVQSMATSIQERTGTLARIAERTETIRRLIKSFENDEEPTGIELSQARAVIDAYREQYPDASISVRIDGDDDATIRHGYMFEVVIEELIDNAVRHNDQCTPTVDIVISETPESEAARIEVADNGPGIPTNTWNVIESGEETPLEHTDGVGLWVVYWAVTALGGTVDYAQNEPRGSVIRVQVPLARAST